ncbi:hypothetical protein Q2941_11230 [Bradyrhizobium sp. UFLA05-153]
MRFDFTALRHTLSMIAPFAQLVSPCDPVARLPLAIAPRLQKDYRIENSIENAK